MIFVNQILEKVDATCAFSWVCGQQLHPIDLHLQPKLFSVLRAIEWYKEHWNPLKICPTYWRRFQANQLDRRQLHGTITWGQSLLFGSLRLKSLANKTGNFSTWNRRTFSAGRISRSARQLQSFRPPFFIHFGVFIGSLALGYTKRKLVTTAPSDLTRQQPWQLEEQSKVWTQLASVPRTADEWQAEEWTRPTQSDGPLWPKMVTNFSLRNAKSHKSQKWRRRWRNEKKLNNFFFSFSAARITIRRPWLGEVIISGSAGTNLKCRPTDDVIRPAIVSAALLTAANHIVHSFVLGFIVSFQHLIVILNEFNVDGIFKK